MWQSSMVNEQLKQLYLDINAKNDGNSSRMSVGNSSGGSEEEDNSEFGEQIWKEKLRILKVKSKLLYRFEINVNMYCQNWIIAHIRSYLNFSKWTLVIDEK